jgi:integrase/recombinase XerD
MSNTKLDQWTHSDIKQDNLIAWIKEFMLAKESENVADGTIKFYFWKMTDFNNFCELNKIDRVSEITPSLIREYLVYLAVNHSPGGVHAYFRALKCFLRWYENEIDSKDFINPIRKIKPPKVPEEILEPAPIKDVFKMIDVCANNLTGMRDKCIILFLLDSGVRAAELISLTLDDVSVMGDVQVRQGKGKKPRTIYVGGKTRKALKAYMKLRKDDTNFLWVTDDSQKLSYRGLKMIMRRRAEKANVPVPSIHSFRRWFALTALNNGIDVFSLQKLLGHSDLSVLKRYIKQTNKNVKDAFLRASPVDRL